MKKFAIIAVAILSLTACNKLTGGGSAAHDQFVKMCKEDPRAKSQGFDCTCQADIIDAVLKPEEMDKLVNFLNVEKSDAKKAMELGKDPQYTPMFQKISGIGLAIHDKCSTAKAETPAEPAASTESVPVTPTPATPAAPAKK